MKFACKPQFHYIKVGTCYPADATYYLRLSDGCPWGSFYLLNLIIDSAQD